MHPFVRSAYNYDLAEASDASALTCPEPTRAQQQFIDECDINTIVRRFGITGQLPTDVRMPLQGDFTEVVDYQTAHNMLIAADAAFMQMPAEVRKRFNHDAAAFVDFCSDPANRDEAIKLGLIDIPTPPPAAPPAAPAPAPAA